MMLAQDARCLLLDEPTSALDLAHQASVLSLVQELSHERGLTVIIVLHDINLAARYCDVIIALNRGRITAEGTPAVLQPRRAASRRRCLASGLLRQPQILQHQGGGKAGLVVIVGGRGRHRPRHRAIGRQRPALARRGRGDVEQRLMRQAELLGEHEGLADADHRNAEDHVVADLGRLPGAGRAAMDDLLAHRLRGSAWPSEGLRRIAAGHEGQRAALGAADCRRRPARRPTAASCLPAASSCALRALSTSMVEQSIISAPLALFGRE
jgi:hypothetical protein